MTSGLGPASSRLPPKYASIHLDSLRSLTWVSVSSPSIPPPRSPSLCVPQPLRLAWSPACSCSGLCLRWVPWVDCDVAGTSWIDRAGGDARVLHPNFSFLNHGPSLFLSLYTHELRRRNSYRPAPPGGQPARGVPHPAVERLASLRRESRVRTGRRAHAGTSLQNAPACLQDLTPTFPERAPHTDTQCHGHPLAPTHRPAPPQPLTPRADTPSPSCAPGQQHTRSPPLPVPVPGGFRAPLPFP